MKYRLVNLIALSCQLATKGRYLAGSQLRKDGRKAKYHMIFDRNYHLVGSRLISRPYTNRREQPKPPTRIFQPPTRLVQQNLHENLASRESVIMARKKIKKFMSMFEMLPKDGLRYLFFVSHFNLATDYLGEVLDSDKLPSPLARHQQAW